MVTYPVKPSGLLTIRFVLLNCCLWTNKEKKNSWPIGLVWVKKKKPSYFVKCQRACFGGQFCFRTREPRPNYECLWRSACGGMKAFKCLNTIQVAPSFLRFDRHEQRHESTNCFRLEWSKQRGYDVKFLSIVLCWIFVVKLYVFV